MHSIEHENDHAPIQEISVPMRKHQRGREDHMIVPGDANLGIVTWLKQVHGAQSYLMQDLEHLGRFQAALLDRLYELSPQAIFYEPLTETILSEDPDREEKILWWSKNIRRSYPEIEHLLTTVDPHEFIEDESRVKEKLSKEQLNYIGLMEATLTYALLNPEVKLLRTCSPEEWEGIVRQLHSEDFIYTEGLTRHNGTRDEYLGREICSYCEQHPGDRSVVVYGVAHSLDSHIFPTDKNPPVLISNEWPEKRREHNRLNTSAIQHDLLRAMGDEKTQLAIIRQANNIFFGTFPAITSEQGQLLAIPKLIFDEYTRPPGGEMQSYLLQHAVSRKVRREIERCYRK